MLWSWIGDDQPVRTHCNRGHYWQLVPLCIRYAIKSVQNLFREGREFYSGGQQCSDILQHHISKQIKTEAARPNPSAHRNERIRSNKRLLKNDEEKGKKTGVRNLKDSEKPGAKNREIAADTEKEVSKDYEVTAEKRPGHLQKPIQSSFSDHRRCCQVWGEGWQERKNDVGVQHSAGQSWPLHFHSLHNQPK